MLDETDTTVAAFLRLNEARNWNEFTSALKDFVVPAQNFVYADVDGHIGYYAPGRSGRYVVFDADGLTIEVTVSGTDLDLARTLPQIEASTRTLRTDGRER